MHFLRTYIMKYRGPFSIAILCVMLEAVCDLLQPTIMSKIIDVGIAGNDLDYIVFMGGVMLLITAVGALTATGRNILSGNVSQRVGTEIRADLYRKIQGLSFAQIDKLDKASLVTRLTNDVTLVQNFTNGLMRIGLKAPLLGIGSLVMATRLNLELAVVLALVVPMVGLILMLNLKMGFPFFLRVQQALDRVNAVMREYLAGVRVVKAFNRFAYEVAKFNQINEAYQNQSIKAMRFLALFSPGVAMTVNFGIVAVLWLGGVGVGNGRTQVGHIIAFINYMTQILFALMVMSLAFNMFVRARASAGRIDEVFSQEAGLLWPALAGEGEEEGRTLKGRVDFTEVYFAYADAAGEPVLKNINLTCLPGETVGIIGGTGAGKSTLVRLIPRFYDTVSGTVKVDGQDVRHLNPRDLRKKIAVVPQKTMLFSGTIVDNIRWGKTEATQEEVERAARIAEAHGFINGLPEGYLTRVGQGGVNLSGGQKQRIALARALIREPEILILDDATSAVDMATEGRIRQALREQTGGMTCLLIAQRITSLVDTDKIVVLDNGLIAGLGKHEELMESCPVYRQIVYSQMGKER